MVDAETGEPVEKEDIGRGYEIAKGQYLLVEDEEIEKIKIESTHTIDIDSFVPRAEIDDRYLDSPYYIAPTDQVGQEAFSVIRDAMREKKMVGLGRVVLTRREHVVMLEAFDKGLLATTLRYPYEVREPAAYFEDIPELKLPAEMMKLAAPHRRDQGRPFRAQGVRGSLREGAGRAARAEAGRAAGRARRRRRRRAQRVINLMDALRASIGAERQEAGGRQHQGRAAGAGAAGKRKTGTLTQTAEPDRACSKAPSPSPGGLRR